MQTGDAAAAAVRLAQYKKENIKITVDGANAIRIDLRVRNPHFGTISGRIVSDDGKPAVGAQVNLTTLTESIARSFGAHAVTDEEGSYRFRGLPAGDYILSANPPSKMAQRGQPRNWLEGSLGATYFPSTIDAGTSPAISVYADRETSDINITLAPRKLHSVAGVVRMMGDGLTEVPDGDVQFGAMVRPDSFYIKSIEANGLDLLRNKLAIADGAEIKDVHIIVSSDVAKLSGRVVSANGEVPLAGVSVMLIPNASDKRWAQAGQLTSVTDSEGNFSVTPPPGEYRIELRRFSHDPPSISKPLLENSPRVTLQPGELKSIEIRIP